MANLYKYIRYSPQDLSDVQIYILHCSIPQENLIKNSDFYIKTHLRKLPFHQYVFNRIVYNILSDKSIESSKVLKYFKIFSAWNVEENKCTSSLVQNGILPELSMGFMGLRAYVLELDCQGQGNRLGRIVF